MCGWWCLDNVLGLRLIMHWLWCTWDENWSIFACASSSKKAGMFRVCQMDAKLLAPELQISSGNWTWLARTHDNLTEIFLDPFNEEPLSSSHVIVNHVNCVLWKFPVKTWGDPEAVAGRKGITLYRLTHNVNNWLWGTAIVEMQLPFTV